MNEMNVSDSKNIHLAQASLEHAIYFLELGATERAASYLKFAIQNLQEATEKITPTEPLLSGIYLKGANMIRLVHSMQNSPSC